MFIALYIHRTRIQIDCKCLLMRCAFRSGVLFQFLDRRLRRRLSVLHSSTLPHRFHSIPSTFIFYYSGSFFSRNACTLRCVIGSSRLLQTCSICTALLQSFFKLLHSVPFFFARLSFVLLSRNKTKSSFRNWKQKLQILSIANN